MSRRLPRELILPQGPCYVMVVGDRGMCFRSWSELESFRIEASGMEARETRVEKFWTVAEAQSWMAASGVREVPASTIHTSARVQRKDEDGGEAEGVVTRLSLTPGEIASRIMQSGVPTDSIALAVAVPGSRELGTVAGASTTVRSRVGRDALLRALDVADRDRVLQTAEMRIPHGAKDWPSFGFQLTLPGNVIFAEASNLTITTASLRAASTPRGRLLAIYIEALNTDLGSIAVALRVNTMSIYNGLKKHLELWRARGGKDSKKRPVPDYDLLVALDEIIRERGLAVRVSESAVAQTEWSRQGREVMGAAGMAGAAAGAAMGAASGGHA